MVTKREIPQTGTTDITTDGSGDGSQAVTLKNPFNTLDYTVVAMIQEADITGNIVVTTKTKNGFTLVVDGSAVVSGTLTVDWMAKQNVY